MTDSFDPTSRMREPMTGGETQPGDPEPSPDVTTPDTSMPRMTPDEFVAPHDQPAEGGREEVGDIEGAEGAGRDPQGDFGGS